MSARTLCYEPTLSVLTLTVGGRRESYGLDPMPHGYGPAVLWFRLWPFGAAESFAVTLFAPDFKGVCSCGEAPRCGHVEALAALRSAGLLPE